MRIQTIISLCFFLLTSISIYGQAGLRPRGDVNCDWEVNIADVNSIIGSVLAGAEYHSFNTYAHDVNGDKEINIADANLIVKAILGQELPPMPSYSGTLPVLFINTDGHRNIVSKEEYLHADWWLDNMGIEGYESIGSPEQPLGMLIKGRGNYTWNSFDKKPFRIKLDTKEKLLGMKSSRHWCLLAHADDHLAKLKNTIGFELSRRVGLAYTPDQRPVEVVLNGQYIGLYFLTEKIRVGENKVNIKVQQDYETNPSLITGGWFLELNAFDGYVTYVQEHPEMGWNWDDMMCFLSVSPEELSWQQKNYIKQFLEDANTAIHVPDKSSTEWEKYIDIDTLAMYYIVAEVMDDLERFTSSCYMYKQRGDSTKLMFGPVWDFGNAFTREAHYGPDSVGHFIYEQPTFFTSHWIKDISRFDHFQEVVRTHWHKLNHADSLKSSLDQYIDEFVESIKPANQADVIRWPDYDINYQRDEFKRYIHAKIDWLNTQWGLPEQ